MRTADMKPADLLSPGGANDYFTRRPLSPFEPNASAFSQANALWLMELSRIVYRRDVEEGVNLVPPRSSFLHNAGLEQLAFFDGKDDTADTQAMLVRSIAGPQWAALVFRGTEDSVGDIVTDLRLSLPLLGQGPIVHEGFEHALDLVWKDIASALANVNVPLFYTGHSLGAALATLAASRHTPRAVYTFGSPLVGNRAFTNTLKNVPIFRVVDDVDEVTMVPPPFLGYLHAGAEHKLAELPEPSTLSLRIKKRAYDHAPVNYIDRM